MMSNQAEKRHSIMVEVCGLSVQLFFAEQENREVPKIVGAILKDAHLQRQTA